MTEIGKPKYQILKEYIINTIKSNDFKPGDKFSSENDLVIKFTVSRHTVRQAIGELVSEGWLYRIHGKGTFVDRRPGLAYEKTAVVGVMMTYIDDYKFPAIIRGIDSVLSSNGYNMMLGCTYNMHDKEEACIEKMMKQNIAGLIVEPNKSALPNPNIELYKRLSAEGIPVIFIHSFYKELNYSYIIEDDIEAGCIAAMHLMELGHSRIGGIFKVDDMQGHYRFKGFQKAHADAGIKLNDSRILWFDTKEEENKFSVDGGDILDELFESCTAIVCYNDQIAAKLIAIMKRKSIKIPDDISLISFDNSFLASEREIKLTTVAHPKDKLGEAAAKAIISMIKRKENYFAIKLKPELIIRQSSKNILN